MPRTAKPPPAAITTPAEQATLVESCKNLAWNMALRYGRPFGQDAIEEFAAAGLYGLVLAARSFDASRTKFTTYCFRQVRWEILHARKAWLRHSGPAFSEELDTPARPSYRDGRELAEQVNAIIERSVPKGIRAAVRLRLFAGKKYADIAELLDISTQGAHEACKRAIAIIRQRLTAVA